MTVSSPRVTVVVPYYEAAATIRETIDSVLAQTFHDFELLVIDDGSDRCPLPPGLSDDPRLTSWRRESNGGYARVTNDAVRHARGEWITFVDADDTIAPHYLERLVEVGETRGASMVFTPMIRHVNGSVIGSGPWQPPGEVADTRTTMRALLEGGLSGTQHLLIRSPHPVATVDQTYSDFAFVLWHVTHGTTVAFVDEPLYFNAVHPGSVTGSLRPGIWDLVRLEGVVGPLIDDVFDVHEAASLREAHRALTLTQILHTAANERHDSVLRREVTSWCRRRITGRFILAQVRAGHWMTAASWVLAKMSGTAHRVVYQCYDSRRKGADRTEDRDGPRATGQ